MTIGLKGGTVEPQPLIVSCFQSHNHARLSTWVLTVVPFTVMLGGCDRPDHRFTLSNPHTYSSTIQGSSSTVQKSRKPIPLPDSALLAPRPEPKCQFEESAHPDPNADERWKLDYERQCYRGTEMIVRYRLQLLQNAVRKMMKAVKQNEGNDRRSGTVKRSHSRVASEGD